MSDYYGKCFVCWREWLSKEDYLLGISDEGVDNIFNSVLIDDIPMPYRDYIKQRGLSKYRDVSKFDKFISVLPNYYDSIDKLHSIGKIADNSMKIWIRAIRCLSRRPSLSRWKCKII